MIELGIGILTGIVLTLVVGWATWLTMKARKLDAHTTEAFNALNSHLEVLSTHKDALDAIAELMDEDDEPTESKRVPMGFYSGS